VLVDGVAQPLLLGAATSAQRQRDREREPAPIEPRGQVGRQPAREREPPLDPQRPAPQELGDGGLGHLVILVQRGDDPGLVHGAGGLGGRVGVQEACLHGGGALDGLDDGRNFRQTVRAPAGQALEAVEDLEGVPGGRHAKRERGQV